MKFTSFEQVEQEFKNRSNGKTTLRTGMHTCPVNLTELSEQKESVEYLLGTEYNTISGMTFSEVMEGVANVISNDADSYISDNKMLKGMADSKMLSESFIGTTQAQTQFPVLNKGLVMYQYEKSVLPYLSHVFDLKANRGLAYYMELVAQNTQGDGQKGDLIASPKTLSKQTTNFITTKMTNVTVGSLVSGNDTYTLYLGGAISTPISIAPQSLVITVDGVDGILQDVSNDKDGSAITLFNRDGRIGDAVVNLNTGVVALVLFAAPTSSTGKIRATFNRDVQTIEGGITNQAVVAPQLTSVQLESEDFSVFSETNLHQQRLAQVIFGIDWNAEVDNLLGACYNREIANKVLKDMVAQIPQNSVATYDIGQALQTGQDKFFGAAFLALPFNTLSKNISKASGLGGLNKVSTYVANIDALPVIQNLPKFKSVETGENFMSGMVLVGTYDGIPVIQAYEPILAGSADGAEVVGIYKSKEKDFLSCSVVGQFILPVIRDIFDQNNLAVNRKQLIASAAVKTVVPQLASKLVITGIDLLL